ncbi:TPA: hypothetical protein ACFB79_000744 [Neisseria gonorrhoeae]|uniref:hypothetical protein n=1 Tax=Neisseria gonorrhoeae TaxID=485 RepID=UPI0018D57C70|nr:hypothetical protein [Neisseria gonorrhoeae]
MDPIVGLARARGRGELDRIEQMDLDFFHRTRARYLELVKDNPKAVVINAEQTIELVQAEIESAVKIGGNYTKNDRTFKKIKSAVNFPADFILLQFNLKRPL